MPFPHSLYNTRYGLSLLPWASFGAVALVNLIPLRRRTLALCLIAIAALTPWVFYSHSEDWIVWKESQINSEARRAWTREAAEYLKAHVQDADSIFTGSGDVNGIFREAGIPFRQTLSVDNGFWWDAARVRPDLFLHCKWAVIVLTPGARSDGDKVSRALEQARAHGLDYRLVKRIHSQDGKTLEIFRRSSWPPRAQI